MSKFYIYSQLLFSVNQRLYVKFEPYNVFNLSCYTEEINGYYSAKADWRVIVIMFSVYLCVFPNIIHTLVELSTDL